MYEARPAPLPSSEPLPGVAASEAAAVDPESGLHRRLVFVVAFRIAAVTGLVGTTALLTFKGGEPLGGPVAASLSTLAIGTNLLQIAIGLLLRLRRGLRVLAYGQIAGDVFFAAALVFLTGGADSLFVFLYLLGIVNGGILLSRHGAWFAAVASFVVHVSTVMALNLGIISPASVGLVASRLPLGDLIQALFTHGSAFALTAVLTSYSAAQLARAGERADEAESSLQKLHALHEAIVRSIASGIVTTAPDGRVNFLNRPGAEILGTAPDALIGAPISRIFPTLASSMAMPAGVERLESTFRRADGAERILGFTITPLLDDSGAHLGNAAVFQDLTDFRALEDRAERSERLAAVGELAAGLAHELRNPLAALSGSIEMLGAERKDPADARLFSIAVREAERLEGLVQDFLAFARPARPRLEEIELHRLVDEVLVVFAADPAMARRRIDASLSPARVCADADQLRQVIWNLMTNAARAASEGGVVEVAAGPGPQSGTAFVSVRDDGEGIAPDVLPRLFDPFFTTRDGGTGLGLATVHRIVDGHGGHIEVDPGGKGKGACFTVVLRTHGEERDGENSGL